MPSRCVCGLLGPEHVLVLADDELAFQHFEVAKHAGGNEGVQFIRGHEVSSVSRDATCALCRVMDDLAETSQP
jgi:hypothetical protein